MSLAYDSPLFETMYLRRTRRFPLGGEMPFKRAGLGYKSKEKPVPLNDLETAILCFASSGITGVTVEEIRHLLGHLTAIGRTAPSPCASLTLHLFFTNDDGVFYYKTAPPEEVIPKRRARIVTLKDREKIINDYEKNLIKLRDGRLDVPDEAIGTAFLCFVNRPGTTLFIPIADTTREYINMLLTGIMQFRWQLWDEVKDQPAGVDEWIDNGFLDGDKITIAYYDAMLPWLCNLEAGMAMQNMALAATALGLGSFMMHTIDLSTLMRLLGVRFEEVKGNGFPQATKNPVGIDGVLEGFCPPYKDVEKAVDEIVAMKWGPEGFYGPKGYDLPRIKEYDDIVEIAKAFCKYLYKTYGRIPKYSNAVYIPLLMQIHHVDVGFYDKFFPEYLNEIDRAHMSIWHPELSK